MQGTSDHTIFSIGEDAETVVQSIDGEESVFCLFKYIFIFPAGFKVLAKFGGFRQGLEDPFKFQPIDENLIF